MVAYTGTGGGGCGVGGVVVTSKAKRSELLQIANQNFLKKDFPKE